MANSKITWANKESLVTDPTIAEKNKVTDSNMNEIKSVVNENADQLIVSDTEPTSNDNEIWIEPNGTIPYVNSEVNIGATNVSNTPVWFKQGKNLFNTNMTQGSIDNNTGNIVSSTQWTIASLDLIPVKPNTTYTFSCISSKTSVIDRIAYFNNSRAFISRSSSLNVNTFTIPQDTYFIRFSMISETISPSDVTNIQIEEGSTATAYESYITPSIIVDNREIYNKPVVITKRQQVTYDSTDQIGSAVFTIDYPTGFNADNTIVLALGYKYANDNQWKFGSIAGSDVNINPFFVTLNYNNENKIRIRFDDVEAEVNYNADFKIVLMRM